MTDTAVLLCGHGSRDVEAIQEFEGLAKQMAGRLPGRYVDHGFLEFAKPTIGDRLSAMRDAGVRNVEAIPGMLFAAGHAKNDIPSVLNNFMAENEGFTISYGRELAIESKMLAASVARIEAAEAIAATTVPREETLLLVVGRGTSDPDANSNISKVARMLWEGMGFGWAEVAYSGVTYPLIAPALERIPRLGYRRIIVFPYFLFTGVLVKRIYEATDVAAAASSNIEFIKAPYLRDHPLVVDSFMERLGEISAGQNLMNCLSCKYREQIIGYEHDQGAAQVGHHHHVEGVGTDGDLHSHDHAGPGHRHDD